MAEAIEVLKKEGATVVDADIPSVVDQDPKNNFLLWGSCSGPNDVRGKDANCSYALKYGMKRDFNAFLASLGAAAPVKTLAELRAFNTAHANRVTRSSTAQANLDVSDELDLEKDRARWQADREKDIRLAATHGIDEVLKAQKLDALLFPGSSGAGIAAKPGYPTVIVPFGLFVPMPPLPGGPGPAPAPYPDGFKLAPAPYGVSFTGTACSEPRLIELAYAFEQATKRRVPAAQRAVTRRLNESWHGRQETDRNHRRRARRVSWRRRVVDVAAGSRRRKCDAGGGHATEAPIDKPAAAAGRPAAARSDGRLPAAAAGGVVVAARAGAAGWPPTIWCGSSPRRSIRRQRADRRRATSR